MKNLFIILILGVCKGQFSLEQETSPTKRGPSEEAVERLQELYKALGGRLRKKTVHASSI